MLLKDVATTTRSNLNDPNKVLFGVVSDDASMNLLVEEYNKLLTQLSEVSRKLNSNRVIHVITPEHMYKWGLEFGLEAVRRESSSDALTFAFNSVSTNYISASVSNREEYLPFYISPVPHRYQVRYSPLSKTISITSHNKSWQFLPDLDDAFTSGKVTTHAHVQRGHNSSTFSPNNICNGGNAFHRAYENIADVSHIASALQKTYNWLSHINTQDDYGGVHHDFQPKQGCAEFLEGAATQLASIEEWSQLFKASREVMAELADAAGNSEEYWAVLRDQRPDICPDTRELGDLVDTTFSDASPGEAPAGLRSVATYVGRPQALMRMNQVFSTYMVSYSVLVAHLCKENLIRYGGRHLLTDIALLFYRNTDLVANACDFRHLHKMADHLFRFIAETATLAPERGHSLKNLLGI